MCVRVGVRILRIHGQTYKKIEKNTRQKVYKELTGKQHTLARPKISGKRLNRISGYALSRVIHRTQSTQVKNKHHLQFKTPSFLLSVRFTEV